MEVQPDGRRLLNRLVMGETVKTYEVIEGAPGGPNNDCVVLGIVVRQGS